MLPIARDTFNSHVSTSLEDKVLSYVTDFFFWFSQTLIILKIVHGHIEDFFLATLLCILLGSHRPIFRSRTLSKGKLL